MHKAIVLTGRTGSGKSTLAKALASAGDFSEVVSMTTRAPRAGEVDGRDYHFVSEQTFRQAQREERMLESAYVLGNWYGVSADDFERIHQAGKTPVMVLDPQGGAHVREWARNNDWTVGVCHIECPTRLSLERVLMRFRQALQARAPDASLATTMAENYALVDRYAERVLEILDKEVGWESAMAYDLRLPAQTHEMARDDAIRRITQWRDNPVLAEEQGEPKPARRADRTALYNQDLGAVKAHVRVCLEALAVEHRGEPAGGWSALLTAIENPGANFREERLCSLVARGQGELLVASLIEANHGLSRLSDGVVGAKACSVFQKAFREQKTDVVRAIVRQWPQVPALRVQTSSAGNPMALAAYAAGKPRLLATMLEAGYDPDQPVDTRGRTLAHISATHGDEQCLALLLRAGASRQARNAAGETVDDTARRWGQQALIERLQHEQAGPRDAGAGTLSP